VGQFGETALSSGSYSGLRGSASESGCGRRLWAVQLVDRTNACQMPRKSKLSIGGCVSQVSEKWPKTAAFCRSSAVKGHPALFNAWPFCSVANSSGNACCPGLAKEDSFSGLTFSSWIRGVYCDCKMPVSVTRHLLAADLFCA
jgi:hypothetical protein